MKIEEVNDLEDVKIKLCEIEIRSLENTSGLTKSEEHFKFLSERIIEIKSYLEKIKGNVPDFDLGYYGCKNKAEYTSKKIRRLWFLNAVDSCEDSDCACHKVYSSDRHNVLVRYHVSYFNGEKIDEQSTRYFETHKTAKKYADDTVYIYKTNLVATKTVIINIEEIHNGVQWL